MSSHYHLTCFCLPLHLCCAGSKNIFLDITPDRRYRIFEKVNPLVLPTRLMTSVAVSKGNFCFLQRSFPIRPVFEVKRLQDVVNSNTRLVHTSQPLIIGGMSTIHLQTDIGYRPFASVSVSVFFFFFFYAIVRGFFFYFCPESWLQYYIDIGHGGIPKRFAIRELGNNQGKITWRSCMLDAVSFQLRIECKQISRVGELLVESCEQREETT